MTLIDQNAFGLLSSFHDIENAEYSLGPEEFVERFQLFRSTALAYARSKPLASGLSAIDLGHALYFEFEDGDQLLDPMSWLRELHKTLTLENFQVVAVLSYGGRWVEIEGAPPRAPEAEPALELVRAKYPSEALRRALYADTASHGSDGQDGWGSGVFVDEDAVSALKRAFKNAPTALCVAGATFFRIGG
jgi:hypothetical protein